jgi:hypothetical protein
VMFSAASRHFSMIHTSPDVVKFSSKINGTNRILHTQWQAYGNDNNHGTICIVTYNSEMVHQHYYCIKEKRGMSFLQVLSCLIHLLKLLHHWIDGNSSVTLHLWNTSRYSYWGKINLLKVIPVLNSEF